MKQLKQTKYWTMNSWNQSTAPAYNLKIYKVVDDELQDKVYQMLDTDEFYHEINYLVDEFNFKHDYKWQAGFNGRSGGYFVLYPGGKEKNGRVYCQPGRRIEAEDVPEKVLKDFEQLAIDIVEYTEATARDCKVVDETYTVEKTRKVLK